MIREIVARVKQIDPVKRLPSRRWIYGSTQALLLCGVLFEDSGAVIEDVRWLHPDNDSQYINFSQLNAVVKGINLALQW